MEIGWVVGKILLNFDHFENVYIYTITYQNIKWITWPLLANISHFTLITYFDIFTGLLYKIEVQIMYFPLLNIIPLLRKPIFYVSFRPYFDGIFFFWLSRHFTQEFFIQVLCSPDRNKNIIILKESLLYFIYYIAIRDSSPSRDF